MKNKNLIKAACAAAALALQLTACSTPGSAAPEGTLTTETSPVTEVPETAEAAAPGTVDITDVHGRVTVPVNPKRVVSLDNRTFETLSDWGIELAAVPKDVMPDDSPYVSDESVLNIGNHREPNLEIIAAADPELVIVGQRFAGFYEDIKALVPNAAVIDLNLDVSEEAAAPGENLVEGLKAATFTLGRIFDKETEAQQLAADFDKSIAGAAAAYNGKDTIMSVVVSGGTIGYSAPGSGRVWGPMYEIFGWVPALSIENATSDHQGDDISVEGIAQSNPDWLLVLDRDADASDGDSLPAVDVINHSPALKNITAMAEGHVIYAPAGTYTNESIQTFMELFENLAGALAEQREG